MTDYPEYIRDPKEIELIDCIPAEGSSIVKRELRKTLYNHVSPPKKRPASLTPKEFHQEQQDRVDQGVASNLDGAFDQLAAPDETAIGNELDELYEILTDYDPVPSAHTAIVSIAPTVARKRLSMSQTLWYGSFEVAKQVDETDYEAVCFSEFTPVDEYPADESFIAEEDDDLWIPTYGIKQIWHLYEHPPDDALQVQRSPNGDKLECSRGHPDEADIHIHSPRKYEYGTELTMESPKAAKDAIQSIPTNVAYQNFVSPPPQWRFNSKALLLALDALTADGWTIALSPTVEDRYLSVYLTDPSILNGDLPPVPDC